MYLRHQVSQLKIASFSSATDALVGATAHHQRGNSKLNEAVSSNDIRAALAQQPLRPSASKQEPASTGPASTAQAMGSWSLNTHAVYRQRIAEQERGHDGAPLPSSRFAPLRVTVCLDHMPQHWAPCVVKGLTKLDVEYAEEVLYPPVKVRIPGFVNEADKERWMKTIAQRGLAPKEGGLYLPIHTQGQNFILRNARYLNNPTHNDWAPSGNHVMGSNTEIQQFESTQPKAGDRLHEELFLANTPQSSSYQHFSDHTPKIVMQGRHMLTNATDVLTGWTEIESIVEAWTWLPVNASRVIYKDQPTFSEGSTFSPPHFTKRLLHSCRTPFWGPYNLQRWAEQVLGPTASKVPMDERKVVLYYSRASQLMRRVLNEEALVQGIQELLVKRGLGETLVMMNFSSFPNYKSFVTYVNRNVRAFVGPHGGGMLNIQWLAKDTLVIEFQHYAHINYAMWEFSPLLEQNYWCLHYMPTGTNDMNVDVPGVVRLMDAQLGRVAPEGEYLAHDYEWARALQGA